MSPLVICSILGVFSNILTANDNYPVQECGNFSSPIQMELYLKENIFVDFFGSFLESTTNFEHFEKKVEHHTYFISEIRECEKLG